MSAKKPSALGSEVGEEEEEGDDGDEGEEEDMFGDVEGWWMGSFRGEELCCDDMEFVCAGMSFEKMICFSMVVVAS